MPIQFPQSFHANPIFANFQRQSKFLKLFTPIQFLSIFFYANPTFVIFSRTRITKTHIKLYVICKHVFCIRRIAATDQYWFLLNLENSSETGRGELSRFPRPQYSFDVILNIIFKCMLKISAVAQKMIEFDCMNS